MSEEMTNQAPQRYCSSCGELEHGSLACSATWDKAIKERGYDLYGEGIGVGKQLAIQWLVHYMEKEGIELWLTSTKDGEITALKHLPNRRMFDIMRKELGIRYG